MNTAVSPILTISGLKTHIAVRRGLLRRTSGWIKAVDGVDLEVAAGETVGLVGESGCGKTTLGRTILRLTEPTDGRIVFDGTDITTIPANELRAVRPAMQPIFQDPFGSLDPRMTVRRLIEEPLKINTQLGRSDRGRRVAEILDAVGLPADAVEKYPHQFSGGQRQRIAIAQALVLKPKFVVADEPVSALDVSVQSQVINLMQDLKREFALTYLFIAHDLAVVDYIADRIAVMYLGKIVELADPMGIRTDPRHPYTQALLSAIPEPDVNARRERLVLSGDVPSPLDPPAGCRFASRCPIVADLCLREEPPLESKSSGHYAACHFDTVPLSLGGPAADRTKTPASPQTDLTPEFRLPPPIPE